MHVRRTALLAVLVLGACAPVSEPIIAPLPQGAALDTAGRPFVRRVEPTAEYSRAVQAGTRSQTGAPGANYWQQAVRYQITAELDPQTRVLTGQERLTYRNRSPNALPEVRFNLYQNLFTEAFYGRGSPMNTGGLKLSALVFNGDTLRLITQAQYEANQRENRPNVGYIVTGTLARVILPRPIARGDSAVFQAAWSYTVPPQQAPRTGWEDALGGRVLQVAQWYPQIAVYDDVVGTDVTPYREQGEFYLEYGDFDVTLTLPAGWLVGGTGSLQNPQDVLTPLVRQRLEAAARSDSTTSIVGRDLIGNGTAQGNNGRVTWRFAAQNVRDFAWATSNRYLWDARRAQIPNASGGGTRDILVHTLYRPGAPGWEQSAHYGEHSIEYHSRQMVPYVYPQITVTEGPIYGMEYPMIVFIGRPTTALELYEVITHELGHEWFPMMVGQDEAAFAWMDEGFTTYIENNATKNLFPSSDPYGTTQNQYLQIAGEKAEAPLMQHIDLVFGPAFGVSAYMKPGTLLRSLQRTLGDSVFFAGMREYSRQWQFKHPYPWDFFNTMERVAGQDLDWFWYPFWYRTVTLDQGLSIVTPGSGNVTVTVRDFGQAPSPSEIVVTNTAGQSVTHTIPIQQWLNPSTRAVTVTIPVTGTVARVELDPGHYYPDVNRRNNSWVPGGR